MHTKNNKNTRIHVTNVQRENKLGEKHFKHIEMVTPAKASPLGWKRHNQT